MVILLSTIAVVGVVAGVAIYRATRPEVRRPGEDLPEITAKLARNLPAEAPMPRFTDVTEQAGLAAFVSFVGDRTSQLPEDMGSGMAWGDFDNDGDDDLFLVSAGGALGLPDSELAASRLYENRGDGTFVPVASFPDLRIRGMGGIMGSKKGCALLVPPPPKVLYRVWAIPRSPSRCARGLKMSSARPSPFSSDTPRRAGSSTKRPA